MLKLCLLLYYLFLVSGHVSDVSYSGTFGKIVSQLQSFRDAIHLRRTSIEHLKRQSHKVVTALPPREERSLYLGNLPNRLALVRRLTNVWPSLLSLAQTLLRNSIKPVTLAMNSTALRQSALMGLVRLQETYDLSTQDVADATLEGSYKESQMSANDCFDVGVFYFHQLRHPFRAVEWFNAALRRYKDDTTLLKTQLMEYIYLSQCFMGNTHDAILTLKAIIKDNTPFYPSPHLEAAYSYIANSSCREIAEEMKQSLHANHRDVHNVESQRGLCRLWNRRRRANSRLKCRLVDYRQPHLRFRPFKMEEIYLDPPILVFRGVIYDKEINTLKNCFHNRTRRAVVDYDDADEYQDTQFNLWLGKEHDVDGVLDRLNKRSKEITNFDLNRSEDLMLASYAIAAEIKLHFDGEANDHNLIKAKSKADYATLIFYMNDVLEGGLTIFPFLYQFVVPAKGDALLFLNRHPDWQRHPDMEHSGCPVLRGTKWSRYPENGVTEKYWLMTNLMKAVLQYDTVLLVSLT